MPRRTRQSCTCTLCRLACAAHVPGWGTPEEMQDAIKAGHAAKLRLITALDRDDVEVEIVVPAVVGGERTVGLGDMTGRCTFLNDNERCSIHESGFKPLECRRALVCTKDQSRGAWRAVERDREALIDQWNSEYASSIVDLWREKVGLNP